MMANVDWWMIGEATIDTLLMTGFSLLFTVLIASLLNTPFLHIVGAGLLVWIAVKLVIEEEGQDEGSIAASSKLWKAVQTVAIADIIMSLDNVIAVAAAANGSLVLMMIGLAISIPMIVAGAALIMALLDKFPVLIWAGAALLGWISGEVIAPDPVVTGYLAQFGPKTAHMVEYAAAAVGAVLVLTVGGLWRRSRMPKESEV